MIVLRLSRVTLARHAEADEYGPLATRAST
jgi:hypothetical protein